MDIADKMAALREFNDWVGKHTQTLLLKKHQLVFTNDYGIEDTARFDRELAYFVKNVVPARFREAHGGDGATARAVAHAVIWEDRRQRGEANRAKREGVGTPVGPQYQPDLTGPEFERLVGKLLELEGCQVRYTPGSGDQGVDVLATIETRTIAIQCKRSGLSVGNAAVQQISAGQRYYRTDAAWVVSDASYTLAARQLASSVGVRLIDFRDLRRALADELANSR